MSSNKAVKNKNGRSCQEEKELLLKNPPIEGIFKPGYVMQVFVFKHDHFLGWDCFQQDKIRIGSSTHADVILKGKEISDVHAIVHYKNEQILVSDKTDGDGFTVNDRLVKDIILSSFDFIKIGPYSLKIKIKKSTGNTSEIQTKAGPKKLITKEKQIESFTKRPLKEVTEKTFGLESTPQEEKIALEVQKKLKKREETKDNIEQVAAAPSLTAVNVVENKETEPASRAPFLPFISLLDDEDDEEDEDLEANFLLLEKIRNPENNVAHQPSDRESVVEIVKLRSGQIDDVAYLEEGDKYIIQSGKERICQIHFNKKKGAFFYFSENLRGTIISGSKSVDIREFQTPEHVFNRRKGVFQKTIFDADTLDVTNGIYQYLIRWSAFDEHLPVDLSPKEKISFKSFFIRSVAFHIVLIVMAGIIHLLNPVQNNHTPETYFVRMSVDEFTPPPRVEKILPKEVEKQPEEIKPEKKKTEKTKIAQKKKAPPAGHIAQKKVDKGETKISASPKVGGGADIQGNVSTRNIKEAGILGILGTSTPSANTAVISEVTNLDAIESDAPHAGNFKVGGIVGKLESSKVTVVSPGVVTTKGSTQVLRSYGVKGEGTVAALKKGDTGTKQVKGLVKTSPVNSVRVRGGMSREAVKSVIDAHMDEISYCYETALLSNPSVIGKIVFEWKILVSGRVGEVKIKSSSINSNQIHSCIKSCIKSWQFPKPTGGTEVMVSYPFIFDIVGF